MNGTDCTRDPAMLITIQRYSDECILNNNNNNNDDALPRLGAQLMTLQLQTSVSSFDLDL